MEEEMGRPNIIISGENYFAFAFLVCAANKWPRYVFAFYFWAILFLFLLFSFRPKNNSGIINSGPNKKTQEKKAEELMAR